jgi:hypothetical protein
VTVVWINAVALAGLVAVLGPVLVHLLRRQRARRVPFPTVQFLLSTRAAAARFSTPSDLPLLALRVAIVAAAAIAAAQPFLATGWRRADWERRVSRALVVDASESMASAASRVADAVAAERQASPGALEIRTGDLRAGLEQAVSALDNGDAGRAEIVVLSDFHKGTLTAADIAALPADVGLRFIAIDIDRGPSSASFAGTRLYSTAGSSEQRITLDGARTVVALTAATPPARVPTVRAKPDQAEAVAAMRRVVAEAGAPELPADRSLAVIFPGVQPPPGEPPRADWMRRALVTARADPSLRRAAAAHRGEPDAGIPRTWLPVARTSAGLPLVAVAAVDQELVAYVAAAPGDLIGAATLRALLLALARPVSWSEKEVERIPPSQLAGWTRVAKPLARRQWRHQPPGDARWCWGLALLLLAIEALVRRSRAGASEEHARAA